MNPAQLSSSLGGKLNPSTASFSPAQQPQNQQPATSPFDTTSRRSSSSTIATHSSARNNQSQKKKHKKHRRPGLGGEERDDLYAEASAMRNSTSRRGQTSITHLMNISLPPRPQTQFHTPRRSAEPKYARSGIGSGYHLTDKAKYIHANYRFIVDPKGDYRAQALDSDVPLHWEDVLQVLVSSESQSSSCPICLGVPVAPRMAKCGHIFCLPCMIRYMASTDEESKEPTKKKKWKTCPLCTDSVYMSELKPVRWFAGQENPQPKEGEDVILRLVMRWPGSTLALPREDMELLGEQSDIPWYFTPEVTDFARVMKGTEEYMIEQFDAEIEDLKKVEEEDELIYGDETIWNSKAANAVRAAKQAVMGIGNAPAIQQTGRKGQKAAAVPESASAVAALPLVDESPATTWTKINSGDLQGEDGQQTGVKPDAPEPLEAPKMAAAEDTPGSLFINPSSADQSTPQIVALPSATTTATSTYKHTRHLLTPAPTQPYYFYQALPHYYLSSLDIRILKAAYGDFAHLPSTLLPRVERVLTGNAVDNELRKRIKYLGHLPTSCEVSFLECNWRDVVPDDILAQFDTEIQKRRNRNREKEAREEKARLRAEKLEEEERWKDVRKKRAGFAKETNEERFGADDFVPLPSAADCESNVSGSPPYNSHPRPGFGSLSEASTDGNGKSVERKPTVWGTTVLAAQDEWQQEEPGYDGWNLDYMSQLRQDQNDADIAAQMASLGVEDYGEGSSSKPVASSAGGSGGGGGKKKKKQKITLMSTTARRAA